MRPSCTWCIKDAAAAACASSNGSARAGTGLRHRADREDQRVVGQPVAAGGVHARASVSIETRGHDALRPRRPASRATGTRTRPRTSSGRARHGPVDR